MKRHFLTAALGLCLLLAGAQSVMAAGFALYEWSARGNALGGTLVGRADDASAVAFNPAGITQIDGTQIQVGFSAISPMADLVYNGQSTKGADNTWLPPHAYIAHKLNDDWAIGLGVYSRFGLGTEYEKARWPGAANIYYAAIETVSFAPVLSYRLTDTISIGGGIEFVHVGRICASMSAALPVPTAGWMPPVTVWASTLVCTGSLTTSGVWASATKARWKSVLPAPRSSTLPYRACCLPRPASAALLYCLT
jgi:long-subunit fatty acid transport protein